VGGECRKFAPAASEQALFPVRCVFLLFFRIFFSFSLEKGMLLVVGRHSLNAVVLRALFLLDILFEIACYLMFKEIGMGLGNASRLGEM
jgi:hypothetical protein